MTQSQGYASKLIQIRSKQGLSQEELAARLNVSFATVNRWENGRSEPQKAAREAIDEMFEGLGEASSVLAPATRRKRGVPTSGASAATTKPMEQMLWDAACSIRGEKDAAKFKDYLLPLLFLKRLSDVFDDEIDRLAEEYDDRETALEIAEDDHGLLRFYHSISRRRRAGPSLAAVSPSNGQQRRSHATSAST
jgi:type I restriction enzyme M protein